MHAVTLSTAPELRRLIQAAFPDYRKKSAFLSAATDVTLSGTYWDGGSRNEYAAIDLATGRNAGAPQYDPPQFGGPRTDPRVQLPVGVAIVRAGTFCGKPATAHVYLHPDNVARLLPA